MFQLCFNLNKIHDSVGKALRTADQGRVRGRDCQLSCPGALNNCCGASEPEASERSSSLICAERGF